MPLTVDRLEACVDSVAAEETAAGALAQLSEVIDVLSSRSALAEAGIRGMSGTGASYDYVGVCSAFERLLDQATSRWHREASEAMRSAVLVALPHQPPEAPALPSDDMAAGSADVDLTQAVEGTDGAGAHGAGIDSSSESSGPGRAAIAAVPSPDMVDTPGDDPPLPPGVPGDVEADAPMLLQDGLGDLEEDLREPCSCVAVLLAALLPLLTDALPRDPSGVCIIPHPHSMEKQQATYCVSANGRAAFRTNKICDNCGTRIQDQFFYHCSEGCDIDFCQECHRKSQDLLNAFLERAGDTDRESMYRRLFWVIDVTERIGFHVLRRSVEDRARLANELAFEWTTPMFERLTQAAIDVVNAKVVHVQDVKDITSDSRFWYAIGWLQFLYSVNSLPCNTRRVDEQSTRGPKVEYERFILEGINKCEPLSEFQRWREHPSAKVPDVLTIEKFGLTADFCSFLTHSNLVPVSFRRVCLLCDVWAQIQQSGCTRPHELQVPREPCCALLDAVLVAFKGLDDTKLRRPLRVTFVGEEAVGLGPMREFFQVALRAFLDGSAGACGEFPDGRSTRLFRCNGHLRTYWFDEDVDNPDAFRTCGILLGQAILNNVLVMNIFPRVLYERLLQDLGSPCARALGLEDVAMVSEEVARSLQSVLDYAEEDIGEVFGDLGWPICESITPDSKLTQQTKGDFVRAYVHWFFHQRVARQMEPLSAGFRAILGESSLLRSMVDAVQLEKIVCGGAIPVDVAAIQRGASYEGWTPEEQSEYLPLFWEVLSGCTEAEKVKFIVFVTASDRVPLKGWQDLGLTVHKNGVGDDRLPTAYTCFCQLLLPKYTEKDKLRSSLLLAIANSEGFGLR